MSKVIIINSSPRKGANSQVLGETIAKSVENEGGEAIIFNIREKELKACLGCDWCKRQEGDTPACVQKDDFSALIPDIVDADGIAFLSPLYFGFINGTGKNYIDRQYCLFNPGKQYAVKDKRIAVVISCGGAPADVVEGVCQQVGGWFDITGGKEIKTLVCSGTRGPGSALENEAYVKGATDLGSWLAGK